MILTIRVSLALLALLTVQSSAQANTTSEIASSLDQEMARIENGRSMPETSSAILRYDTGPLLEELKRFESASSCSVRRSAYDIAWRIAIHRSDASSRSRVVEHLVDGCGDAENLVWGSTSQHLLSFAVQDFSLTAKQSIACLLLARRPRREVIVLAGVAGMKDQMSRLREIANMKPPSGTQVWKSEPYAAQLALARLGDTAAANYCISVITSEPNRVTRICNLQHHLAYIRQSAVVPVFRDLMESDQTLPPVESGMRSVAYNQYTIDILAHIVKDFPIKPHLPGFCPGGYSQSEIDTARDWVSRQDSWVFLENTIPYFPQL